MHHYSSSEKDAKAHLVYTSSWLASFKEKLSERMREHAKQKSKWVLIIKTKCMVDHDF
jgi:hypothetical protein